MLTFNRPDGYPYTVFLNRIKKGAKWDDRLNIEDVTSDMPPCLDAKVKNDASGPWILIYCSDEPTCIMLAMEFQCYFDGHVLKQGDKIVRLSESLLSRYHEDRRLKSEAANDSD